LGAGEGSSQKDFHWKEVLHACSLSALVMVQAHVCALAGQNNQIVRMIVLGIIVEMVDNFTGA